MNGESETKSLINPLTGLNVQIPTKKVKTATPCPISPVLLECPEQDCSKKYKHANGLKYHQSHAHGVGSMDEDSQQPPESPRVAPPTTPSPAPGTPQPVPATLPVIPVSSQPSLPVTPPGSASAVVLGLTNTPGIVTPQLSQPVLPQPSTPQLPTTPTPPLSVTAPIPVTPTPLNSSQPPLGTPVSGLLTTVPLPPGMAQTLQQQSPALQPQPHQPPQPIQHPVVAAGGSITTGIAASAMQQLQHHQQQQPTLIGASPSITANSQGLSNEPNMTPLSTPQQQHQQLINNSLIQTPTRPDVQGKSTCPFMSRIILLMNFNFN